MSDYEALTAQETAVPTRVRTVTVRFRKSVVKHELCWESMLPQQSSPGRRQAHFRSGHELPT